ncbi:MAG: helix-turn-helix domain-containing protein [Elusimicrobiaceae bacterium]|nr:helix-turn-helix domain-containing protein [Elusimicrobiaceae bacterium]
MINIAKLSKNQKRIQTLIKKGVSKSQIAKIFGALRATLRKFINRFERQI